ncbi:hypothetical protein [Oleiphilus sp. HI0132]|uniref:hypothetical protein n=1 Tax=Oleiphilus sp. HI0132 TaxID=1822270 RepID=UPI0012E732DB|nr:hypothetical protein [Oleiphilus sp. HI0132]
MGERRAAKRVQPRVFIRGEHCATGYVAFAVDLLARIGNQKKQTPAAITAIAE